MTLLLAVVFVCVGLGLATSRFGPRETCLVIALAAAMTALYLFVPDLM